jgi:hypothetical protein
VCKLTESLTVPGTAHLPIRRTDHQQVVQIRLVQQKFYYKLVSAPGTSSSATMSFLSNVLKGVKKPWEVRNWYQTGA